MKLQGIVSGSALLLSGCSQFYSSLPDVAPAPPAQTMVVLSAGPDVNPNPSGEPQPVKVCMWQRPQPGFVPQHALEGSPCQTSKGEGSPFFSVVLSPETHQSVPVTHASDAPLWLVIGADFQQTGVTRSLLEVRTPESSQSQLHVRVQRQSLFLQSVIRN